jgi:Ca2+-binding RTX toxin-like protein
MNDLLISSCGPLGCNQFIVQKQRIITIMYYNADYYSRLPGTEGDDVYRFGIDAPGVTGVPITFNGGSGTDTVVLDVVNYYYLWVAIKVNDMHSIERIIGSDVGGNPFYFNRDLDLKDDNKITYMTGIEGFYGNDLANTFKGSDFAEKIAGNGGADTIYGNGGDDIIYGDVLHNNYNFNYDYIHYSSVPGNDILDGGAGNDTLTGGGGADQFMFSANEGLDTITDFNISEHDKIVLRASTAGLTSGANDSDYFVFGTAAPNADHGYIMANADGVWWDPDGSGDASAVQFIRFSTPVSGLSFSDFLVV